MNKRQIELLAAQYHDSQEFEIPTLDELPQADTSDLELMYQYQKVLDNDFNS
jgi:hypothetical protein